MDSIRYFPAKLAGKATAKDIFLGITTSAQPANILKALELCQKIGIPSIVFCARDGGRAKHLADYFIIVPCVATSTIQESHFVLVHTLCESVEAALFT